MKLVETKQVIDLAVLIAVEVATLSKDGFQFSDLIKLFENINGDADKKATFEGAIKDIKNVQAELQKIDLDGGVDLAVHVISKVPLILEALKKETPVTELPQVEAPKA